MRHAQCDPGKKRNVWHLLMRITGLGLVMFSLVACEPHDRRPGFWLSGDVVKSPVTDWSFTSDTNEIFVETSTWYGIPHSVTTVCAATDKSLYVPSIYYEGGTFPDAKFWNRNIAARPNVRLKIGEKVYPLRASLVNGPDEFNMALQALAVKYPFWAKQMNLPSAERVTFVIIRMSSRQ